MRHKDAAAIKSRQGCGRALLSDSIDLVISSPGYGLFMAQSISSETWLLTSLALDGRRKQVHPQKRLRAVMLKAPS